MTDFTPFAPRDLIGEAEARALQQAGVLALDPERALPLWFDGRFLTARDLNREQNYFLARQTAIGRAVGRGVIEGLEVTMDPNDAARLTIGAGQGIAFDGNHIIAPQPITVNLGDLAVQDAINAALGLSATPAAPMRSRSGLFVLSLRAVEYTANDVASFPTTPNGARSLTHGDRIEAAAVTLTPYAAVDTAADAAEARTQAATRIFLGLEPLGTPGNALPLAMIALRIGAIEWIDPHLVRRELIAARRDFLGLGLGRDQLRLAHFNQYQAALDDVVTAYRDRGAPPRFAAEQHFRILPAAGPMPAACIDPAAQTQSFFPGEVEVELSIIPEDELPALIDDSFELPPLDLSQPAAMRDSLSVMILAPMPRQLIRAQIAALGALRRPLRPTTVLGQSSRKPIEKLRNMRISLAEVAASLDASPEPATQAWAALVRSLTGTLGASGAPYLWYVRRRTLRENVDLESVLVEIDQNSPAADTVVLDPSAPVGGATPVPSGPANPPPPAGPEPLGAAADAALLKLSNSGDLAKLLETELRREDKPMREVFLKALGEERLIASPLRVAASILRLGGLSKGDAGGAGDTLTVLLKTDDRGVVLLDKSLVGPQGKIAQSRFKQLGHFLGAGLFPATANALPKLDPAKAADFVGSLAKAIDTDANDTVTALVKDLVANANANGPVLSPNPTPTPTPEPEPAALDRSQADALIKAMPDRATQTAMAKIFAAAADPVTFDALQNQLAKAELPASRVVTQFVVNRLGTGAPVDAAALGQIKGVTGRLVQGMAALEPALLDVADTAPTSLRGVNPGLGVRPAPARGLAAARPVGIETPGPSAPRGAAVVLQNRIQRVSENKGMAKLAEFGLANAAKPAALAKAAAMLIDVLDDPATDATALLKVIADITGGAL